MSRARSVAKLAFVALIIKPFYIKWLLIERGRCVGCLSRINLELGGVKNLTLGNEPPHLFFLMWRE